MSLAQRAFLYTHFNCIRQGSQKFITERNAWKPSTKQRQWNACDGSRRVIRRIVYIISSTNLRFFTHSGPFALQLLRHTFYNNNAMTCSFLNIFRFCPFISRYLLPNFRHGFDANFTSLIACATNCWGMSKTEVEPLRIQEWINIQIVNLNPKVVAVPNN